MFRSRVKIALLSLGVVLGYGSAAFHYVRGHHQRGSCSHDSEVVKHARSE